MEKPVFSVRKAKPEEWETAMELVWKTFLKFEAADYGEVGTKNFLEFISGEQLYKMFLNGDYVVWVALNGSKIVGVSSLRAGSHISLLFVDESYQRMGVGRLLIKTMQESLTENGSVKLTVNSSPYGEEFYHKLGFTDVKERQSTDGIICTPMILLKRI